jgi:hypothetical protein
VGIFGVPTVESENDIAVFLGFREVDVWTIGDEERREIGIIRDAFIEESFVVCCSPVGLVFRENKDAGYNGVSCGRM